VKGIVDGDINWFVAADIKFIFLSPTFPKVLSPIFVPFYPLLLPIPLIP
jgi:hypothetical protein